MSEKQMTHTVEICNTVLGSRSSYEYSSFDGAKDRAMREASRCQRFVRIEVRELSGKVVYEIWGVGR